MGRTASMGRDVFATVRDVIPTDPRLDPLVEDVRRARILVGRAIDGIYPDRLSLLSPTHWTPLDVARRPAALPVVDDATRANSLALACLNCG